MVSKKVLIVVICCVILISAGIIISWQNLNRFWHQEPIAFDFESSLQTTTSSISLNVRIDTGFIWIQFEENESLFYKIHLTTSRGTIQQSGEPNIELIDDEIRLVYTIADVTITLGSGVNYTLDIHVNQGKIFTLIANQAKIQDIDLATIVGDIELRIANSTIIQENITIDIHGISSSVDVTANLPLGIGGNFVGNIENIGNLDIEAPTWTQISTNHYQTSDFHIANVTVSFFVNIEIGNISATLE